MKRNPIRSTLFNIAFLAFHVVICVVYLPTLLLPRKIYNGFIHAYHYMVIAMEYFILGLRYEVRGQEHLPEGGAYLVAAKHMSTYETFKLRILFKDPSIILKKELLRIPLWGYFLKKTGVIAIDRSTPETARESIKEGALRMKEQGRPVVIFPQGTRVWPNETAQDKPYKSGIHRMQSITELPVVPMATNSGMFWPRSGWLKSSGTVVFKFLPPVAPGMDKESFMKHLQTEIEDDSLSLMNEAVMDQLDKKSSILLPILFIAALFGAYSFLWFEVAKQVKTGYSDFMSELGRSTFIEEPVISGFPGPIKLDVLQENLRTPDGELQIKVIHARGWPIPFTPISIITGPIEAQSTKWAEPIIFDSLKAELTAWDNVVTVRKSLLSRGDFVAAMEGEINLNQKPVPKMDLLLGMLNHQPFLLELASKGIIRQQMAMFVSAGFSALLDPDGWVRVPLNQKGNTLYAGPLPVLTMKDPDQPLNPAIREESLPELPRLEPYNQLGPDQ